MDIAQTNRKPDLVTAIAVLTLASGILNLFWSIGVFLGAVVLGLGTFLVGCLCIPLGVYPLALGIAEIVYAARLMKQPAPADLKPSYAIAILEIIDTLLGNVLALVAGVLALIFYNDPAVRRYFGET
jgi:hypothetical protein